MTRPRHHALDRGLVVVRRWQVYAGEGAGPLAAIVPLSTERQAGVTLTPYCARLR